MMLMRKHWKWFLLALVALLVAARFALSTARVQLHEVQPGPLAAEVMGTGTLEARVKTTISPRIQERLAEVLVDQGDGVRAGRLLARLDDGELMQQVEVATAAVAAARASLERVKTDEARVLAVEKQARLDHQRTSDLLATKVTSQADFDKAMERLNVAEADVKRSRASIAEAGSQLTTAEKNLLYQKERLSFTRIVSPYDGLITRRDRDPGGVVVPGSSILQLIATNELWVSAWVDETASAALRTGQTARVVFRSAPGNPVAGEVARLGREADRETREFLVDVRVRELPVNWTVGQRAEVFIETSRKADVLAVPQRFLQWHDGKPGVFVVSSGRAIWRGVTTGLRGRAAVEVTQGLAAGEKVIAPAEPKQAPLKPGQRVAVE
jgi:HlyD family secretion protein